MNFHPVAGSRLIKTEQELNQDILAITMRIKDEFSELSKYIEEMPVTIPDVAHPEITSTNLKAYYDSLDQLLKKYIIDHLPVL